VSLSSLHRFAHKCFRSNTGGESPVDNLKAKRKLRKNNREKQRRSEINDKFEELANVLNVKQKNKTEKHTILAEAISLIHSLQTENHELKMEKQELRVELSRLTNSLQQAFPIESTIRQPAVPDPPIAPINLQEAASFILEHAGNFTTHQNASDSSREKGRSNSGDVMQGGEAMMRLAAYAQMMQNSPDGLDKLPPFAVLGQSGKLDGSFSGASQHQSGDVQSLSSRGARGAFAIGGKPTQNQAEDLDLFSN
jgi:hypothetical protein